MTIKTTIAKTLIAGAVVVGAANLPVIPDNTYFVKSPTGKGIHYQTVKNVDKKFKETKENGRRCYNEFTATGKDSIVEFIPCSEYWKIAKTPNYPAPFKEGYVWHGYDTIKFDTPSGDLEDGYFYVEEKDYRSLLEPQKAQAAIALDTATNGGSATSVCSDTWTHVVAGSNTFMVGTSATKDSIAADRAVDTNGFTYNGTAMTRADGAEYTSAGAVATEIFYLIAPASGSHTVSVTWCTSGSVIAAVGGAISYTGVDQTTGIDAHNAASFTNSGSNSISVTTVADNSWVAGTSVWNTGVAFANPAATQTERHEVDTGAGSMVTNVEDLNGPKTPAGAQTMDWTCSGGSCTTVDGALAAMSFAPVSAPANPPPPRTRRIIND